jgi:hypothetical protein
MSVTGILNLHDVDDLGKSPAAGHILKWSTSSLEDFGEL